MFCSRLLLSINYLMTHIKLNHKFLMHSEVQCNFEKCFQIYNDIYSLKRHILSEHVKDRSHLQKREIHIKNIAQKTNRNVLQSTLNNSILNKERNNIINMMSSTCNENNDTDISELKEKINECATHLVVKLYAHSTLNRNIIHEIISNISSFYNSICLEFLKKIQKYR